MAKRSSEVEAESRPKPRRAPARTPEAREKQIINLTYDLAEKQISEGTASSQTMSHFLKLGSTREELEKLRLQKEILLLEAKVEQIKSAETLQELYEGAISAMQIYTGNVDG